MILKEPFIITSRLCPGVKLAGATISLLEVKYGERDSATFAIDFNDGAKSHIDSDLRSGMQGFRNTPEIFESYLGFLGAAAESIQYGDRNGEPGDNADLFPPRVSRWAADNSDEIDMLRAWIEEEGVSLIKEG